MQADSGPGKSGVLVKASHPILLLDIIGRSSSETRVVTADPKAKAKGLLAQSHALEAGGLKPIQGGSARARTLVGACQWKFPMHQGPRQTWRECVAPPWWIPTLARMFHQR